MPKVSVIMPVRNAAATVADSVASVLAQGMSDFELLIGDDASEDDTPAILSKLPEDPRVKVVRWDEWTKRPAMRNKLLTLASGELVSYCDADDAMLPGNLKKCVSVLDSNLEVGVVYGDILIVREDEQAKVKSIHAYGCDTDIMSDLITPLCVLHQGSMVRRRHLEEIGLYKEFFIVAEDQDAWYHLREVTKFQRLTGEVIHCYRDRYRSVEERAELNRYHKEAKRRAILRRYGECPLTKIDW